MLYEKHLYVGLVLVFLTANAFSQEKKYEFPAPPGWQTELFAFPIKFAPHIPLSGTEELHLSPGWGKKESSEYWSYVFVWFLNGEIKPGTAQLNKYLEQYYTGLYLSNLGKKQKPAGEFTKVAVEVTETKDNDTFYKGEINTLDFLTGEPLTLQLNLDIRKLADEHTAFLYEISPQSRNHPVWNTLDTVSAGFNVIR